MKPSVEELPRLLARLLECYEQLLSEESRRVDCYLSRDLEAADALRIAEEGLVEEIRGLHARVREVAGTQSPGEQLGEGETPLKEMRAQLGALSRTVQEVQQAVHRSRCYIFRSLRFSQAMLRPLLGGESGHYDGEGFLLTNPDRVTRRGVRA